MSGDRAAVVELLFRRGVEDIRHPGGTLLVHLHRVEERLRSHGADDVACLAALAHAVYGTDGFPTALLALDERHVLARAGGDDVEQLVHLYAACDRTRSWSTLAQTGEVHDRWTGQAERPTPKVLGWFVDLSTVNELDVLEHAPELMDAHAAALSEIFHSWTGLGSAAVTADAARVLGTPL